MPYESPQVVKSTVEGMVMQKQGSGFFTAPEQRIFAFSTADQKLLAQHYPNNPNIPNSTISVTSTTVADTTGINADLTFDIGSGTTSPQLVFRKSRNGAAPFLSQVSAMVVGSANWAGGYGVGLGDALGNTAIYYPLSALQAYSQYTVPNYGIWVPNIQAVTAYNSTSGAITCGAGAFVASGLAGCPFTVASGTGYGQTGIISTTVAMTSTVLTPQLVLPRAIDTTSYLSIPYWQATAGGGTTITASNASFSTSALTAGGFYVVIVQGTGAGQVRLISSNSATVLTVPTWGTNPDSTSVFMVTNNPALMGVYDASVSWNSCNLNGGQGLYGQVYGTMSAGSTLHLSGFGYYGVSLIP